MNSIKQILAIASVGMLLINCPKSKDNDDDLLLGLAILSQQNVPTFTSTTPAFTLLDGEQAFVSTGNWGTAETKFTISGLERKSAVEITYTLNSSDSYVDLYFNVENNLTNAGGTTSVVNDKKHYIRLEASRIRGYGGNTETTGPNSSQATSFAASPGIQRTWCIESHREIKSVDNGTDPAPSHSTLNQLNSNGTTTAGVNGKFRKIEAHHIAWNKPCSTLTTADRGTYFWDVDRDIESASGTAYPGTLAQLSEWARGTKIGYVVKNANVFISPQNGHLGAAGSFR